VKVQGERMTKVKTPTSEWLKSKLNKLIEMKDMLKTISPELYTEVDPDYGFWSLKKEIALMYWIYTFQTIANIYFDSYYYIDLFAGSGLMEAENCFFVGSPIVAVSSTLKEKPFSKYICIECDEARRNVLEQRMNKACAHHETCGAEITQADCNQEIGNVLREYSPLGKTCYLAFVDPQKYTDLRWQTLETLMSYGTGDIILNFPTMSLNRNITKVESRQSVSDFIGDEDWTQLNPLNIDNVLEHYKNKMNRFRREVHSIQVKGDKNNRLFDLVFATNSKGMKNAMEDLKEKLNAIRTKDIKGLYSVVAEGQMQMEAYFKKRKR
jgi:three-Cys-motif partner protein